MANVSFNNENRRQFQSIDAVNTAKSKRVTLVPSLMDDHRTTNFKFGINQNSEFSSNMLAFKPGKFITKEERLNLKINHVSVGTSQKEVNSMFHLPKIFSRKLDDFDGGNENPFKVIKQDEKLLVYHEKQREIQMLEMSKRKIEMKYLRGDDHLVHLSSNRNKERRGLIRDINSIPASDKFGIPQGKGTFHSRANSVQPSRN